MEADRKVTVTQITTHYNTQCVKPLSGYDTAAEDLISLKKKSNSTLHYITFYLADAFIQSDLQSSAIQGHTTTEHTR